MFIEFYLKIAIKILRFFLVVVFPRDPNDPKGEGKVFNCEPIIRLKACLWSETNSYTTFQQLQSNFQKPRNGFCSLENSENNPLRGQNLTYKL